MSRCDYSTMDWWCEKQEGHEGPHEQVIFIEPFDGRALGGEPTR